MPDVRFTSHLRLHFPDLEDSKLQGETLAEVVVELDRRHPGLANYIIDDQGSLRKHVNIFVNEQLLTDRVKLGDPVAPNDRIFIMQALSGG